MSIENKELKQPTSDKLHCVNHIVAECPQCYPTYSGDQGDENDHDYFAEPMCDTTA